jgi:hypothetical protein
LKFSSPRTSEEDVKDTLSSSTKTPQIVQLPSRALIELSITSLPHQLTLDFSAVPSALSLPLALEKNGTPTNPVVNLGTGDPEISVVVETVKSENPENPEMILEDSANIVHYVLSLLDSWPGDQCS